MLTSKERAELRAQANTLETTLIVGKSGVTDTVIGEAENQLTARELVKGKVLEGALMSPREVSDAICEATGADGVAVIGTKFVIYRFSEKLQEERNQSGRAKRKAVSVAKSNPVRKGAKAMTIITNDAWWGNTPGYRQHLSYASLRAIETRRAIARCANTGISAIISPYGEILQPTPWWEQAVISGSIPLRDDITFFVSHGDITGRICTFLFILLLLALLVRGTTER